MMVSFFHTNTCSEKGKWSMFAGIYTAMATPVSDNQKIDLTGLPALVQFQEKAGVHGLFVGGTGGEGILFTLQERLALLETVMQVKKAQTGIIVHCSAFHPAETVVLMRQAAELGADAVALLPPGYYSPLDEEAVYQYYQRMCAESSLPVMIYHLPAYSHFRISFRLFERLMTIENLVGIKDSSGDILQLFNYSQHPARPIAFVGQDQAILAALLNGVPGVISAPANLMPKVYTNLYDASQRNDMPAASLYQQRVNLMLRHVFKFPFIPAIKQVLQWLDLPAGPAKFPDRSLSLNEQKTLKAGLTEIGFFDWQ
ncbi:MAG TPA: dihydrodipicolinate synthase family protein [Chloroflexi bacterium]|nr:dihydrodipicolinate synthase family protein [Chloroflexota bacterium]